MIADLDRLRRVPIKPSIARRSTRRIKAFHTETRLVTEIEDVSKEEPGTHGRKDLRTKASILRRTALRELHKERLTPEIGITLTSFRRTDSRIVEEDFVRRDETERSTAPRTCHHFPPIWAVDLIDLSIIHHHSDG